MHSTLAIVLLALNLYDSSSARISKRMKESDDIPPHRIPSPPDARLPPPPPPLKLPPPPPPLRAPPLRGVGGGDRPPMGGGIFAGFQGLKKTNNLAKLQQRAENSVVTSAPTDIIDAVFVNCPQKATLAEVFEARNAKLLLVDFFAFSCTNCIRAGKTIHDLHDKYSKHGLEILAFARPEFKFEGETDEVAAWIQRNHVKFDVATDAKGTNWKSWKVDSWPTHFLVQKDKRSGHEGEFVISYTHVGDRNSHNLYNEIIKQLTPDAPQMPPMNSKGYTDVEIFFGESHKSKNTGDGCNTKTKACKLDDPNEADIAKASALPRPQGKMTVYGTGYCPFCRMTKTLLEMTDTAFDYVNLADFGGPASALALLKKESLIPESHKTIPVVFNADGDFLGGYTETKKLYPDMSEEDIKRATPAAPVPPEVLYKKHNSEARVSIPKPEQWAAGKEDMVALNDGAELVLSANLVNAPDGISFYVVSSPGTIQVGGESKEIEFSGRHYLRSYSESNPSDEVLTFSKGMKVYVFWLSAEPHAE